MSPREGMANTYVESRSLGGTDAGAIIGVNRYKTVLDIFDRLTGVSRPIEDSPILQRGRVMEPIIAELYAEQTGRTLAKADRVYHDEHPFLHSSPDFMVTSGLPVTAHGTGVLEIKCLGQWTFKQTKEEGVDPSYYAQLQHYLFVNGLQWGSFAIFNADLWELYTIDVMRDEPLIAHMVDACVRFWNGNVLPGIRPETAAAPSPFVPPNIGAEYVTTNDAQLRNAMLALKAARENMQIAEHAESLADEYVRSLLPDADVKLVVPGGGKITHQYESKTVLDKDRLVAEHPEINFDTYSYKKRNNNRTLRVTFKTT